VSRDPGRIAAKRELLGEAALAWYRDRTLDAKRDLIDAARAYGRVMDEAVATETGRRG
jgi:hypothetical protein